jgi:hypothetical protein
MRVKLEWLAAHPAESVAMGAAARLRVLDLFRWETVVERCLAIYEGSGVRRCDSRDRGSDRD